MRIQGSNDCWIKSGFLFNVLPWLKQCIISSRARVTCTTSLHIVKWDPSTSHCTYSCYRRFQIETAIRQSLDHKFDACWFRTHAIPNLYHQAPTDFMVSLWNSSREEIWLLSSSFDDVWSNLRQWHSSTYGSLHVSRQVWHDTRYNGSALPFELQVPFYQS